MDGKEEEGGALKASLALLNGALHLGPGIANRDTPPAHW